MGRETKGGRNHITFVELARRQIPQHGAHKLVLEFRTTQLAQHDIALLDGTIVTL
jgi:hypothetical protein